ncbi:monovalent cation/H+ antiporter complex subunit F [Isoptericola variabilis]|uniref:Multiple resistance and pH regulation protein F n=1 Tax=Isoptericola variabilis (strain 225) TaxID=743718 RepID=F6FSV3_ISOV2|nr:monovalent cation/H+ antiporter complex subunit F [Isoptericola variabilis]AEG43094.1 multiple resistance and pH regulation protein F [Isoptericola variabilis 225]TWH35021.1 multicomponent Na+:H+ antiporter subunit F [Isoptericola variabilis J7]
MDDVLVVVGVLAAAMLAVGATLAVVRVERGPSMLDRTVAFDVLTTTLVGVIALEAALSRRTETIPILVVLSLVGFIGSVVISRFAARERPEEGAGRGHGESAAEGARSDAEEQEGRDAAVDPEHHGGGAEGQVG